MKTLSLPADVMALLRDGYDRSVELNSNSLAQELRKPRDATAEWADGLRWGGLKSMTPFQLSARLLGALEELEVMQAADTDFNGHVTATLTCEFHIYKLNCSTPLRYNPFLHHWVTTCARIQQSASQQPDEMVPWQWKARLEIIKLALTSPGVQDGLVERGSKNMEKRSPESIIEKVKKEMLQPVDLESFVQMLWQQGLPLTKELRSYLAYEDQLSMFDQDASFMDNSSYAEDGRSAQEASLRELLRRTTESAHRPNASIGSQISDVGPEPYGYQGVTANGLAAMESTLSKGKSAAPSLFPITSRSTTQTVQQALEEDLDETSHTLMRLPLDLSSLELLTKLIEGGVLVKARADVPTITREYIQHCLRIIERLGTTFSPTSDSGGVPDGFDVSDGIPSGREEQTRAVKLLIMFMKNLLRKGLLPVQELAFDLEEICVRYIWIAEVREFRKFLEGGDVVDAAHPSAVHGIGG